MKSPNDLTDDGGAFVFKPVTAYVHCRIDKGQRRKVSGYAFEKLRWIRLWVTPNLDGEGYVCTHWETGRKVTEEWVSFDTKEDAAHAGLRRLKAKGKKATIAAMKVWLP